MVIFGQRQQNMQELFMYQNKIGCYYLVGSKREDMPQNQLMIFGHIHLIQKIQNGKKLLVLCQHQFDHLELHLLQIKNL